MDFLRLAMREARRNATRTLVGVIAVALAAAAPVVSRMIPQGYVRQFGLSERTFVAGDILVWPAPAPVDLRDKSALAWRFWDGRPWQSHILYFLPAVETQGYLAEEASALWRPIAAGEVEDRLRGIEGVTGVSPYLTLPCTVETASGPVPAILRGSRPDSGAPSSFAPLVAAGRPLSSADDGTYSALVPLHGGPAWEFSYAGMDIKVNVPSLTESGLDWEQPVQVVLTAVGGYRVQIGDTIDYNQPNNDRYHSSAVVPVYWERPEIAVTEDTFLKIAGRASAAAGKPVAGAKDFPVYQVSIAVSRMSSLEATVSLVRAALGSGFAVYSVPQLLDLKSSAAMAPVVTRDLWPLVTWLAFGLSAVLVAGSVYILLAQQRRKIGLFRVIGATRANIVTYSLGIAFHIAGTGVALGFLAGKFLSLPMLVASDLTLGEWLSQAGRDLLMVSGVSFGLTAVLGLAVGIWASRIPCAEVLRRD